MSKIITQEYLRELDSEAPVTRKCLENVKLDLMDWAPHAKSMKMGGLVIMAADIPHWIAAMITDGVIDFKTYPQFQPKTNQDLLDHFDKSLAEAKDALANLNDEDLSRKFILRNGEQVYWEAPLSQTIGNTINHWVHHRGQLTVYMKMNGLPVPALYGPSGDEGGF
jgi:uncharacterized damage-inducible protein DinB